MDAKPSVKAATRRICGFEKSAERFKLRHGRARPGHPRLAAYKEQKTWMPGIADKFTQSAQGRPLRPGMTSQSPRTSRRLAGLPEIHHPLGGRRHQAREIHARALDIRWGRHPV